MTSVQKRITKRITGVTIHHIVEGWDDGDPLYEVDCTIRWDDKTSKRFQFDWVRAGSLHSLKHPRSKTAQQDIASLIGGNC